MKKVLRCCKTGTEMEMRCMAKRVGQQLKLVAEVCHSMTYQHNFTINRTSRWHQWHQEFTLQMNHHKDFLVAEVCHSMTYQHTFTINRISRWHQWHQEFTLQMNHYQNFIKIEDSEATIIAELIYIYPTSAISLSTV